MSTGINRIQSPKIWGHGLQHFCHFGGMKVPIPWTLEYLFYSLKKYYACGDLAGQPLQQIAAVGDNRRAQDLNLLPLESDATIPMHPGHVIGFRLTPHERAAILANKHGVMTMRYTYPAPLPCGDLQSAAVRSSEGFPYVLSEGSCA